MHEQSTTPAPPVAASDGEADILNEEAALKRLGGDRGFLRQLAGMFLEEGRELLAEVEAGLAVRSAPRIRRAAHTFRGAVCYLAADTAEEAAQRLEQVAADGDLAAASEAAPALAREANRLFRRLAALAGESVESR